MNRSFRATALFFALISTLPAYATNLANTPMTETGEVSSTAEGSVLSKSEQARARTWNLSGVEWQRYQQLMQGIRGSISPETISPIEVLGIHARDEAERQRYAEAWSRAMHEDMDRILAFQHAYDAANKRLYPNETLIYVDQLPVRADATSVLQSSDRLLFFARPACPICDVLMNKLLKRIDKVVGIDIYLTDIEPGDDAAVRAWASTHQIDPGWVRSRRVTLNHDGGALDKLTGRQGEVPYLLRRRGEDLSPLRASDL